MPRSPAWLSLLSLFLLLACDASSGPSLAFSLRFANPATATRASSVEVSIVSGSCSSSDIVYTAWITRDAQGTIPPRLASGNYALLGRAASSACGLIAYGCVQTTLPAKDGSTIEIVLDDVPEQPICTGVCADRCDGERDGGPNTQIDPDAALSDAGPGIVDAGEKKDANLRATDGGVEAGNSPRVDAGPSCDGLVGPNARCYRFDSDTLSFALAEAKCVTWGGHLVSFNDEAEELWVTQRAASLGTFGTPVRFWIGFTDEVLESTWTWLDGSAPTSPITFDLGNPDKSTRFKTTSITPYTHWGPNLQTVGNTEPNNSNIDNPVATPGEDCAESRSDRVSAPGGIITPRPEWDDASCTASKRFVCERG